MRALKSVLSLTLVAVMLLTGLLSAAPAAKAAYQGSGTQADPYLVTTAEQLDDMRKDLTAHYKLAATIDLSGIDNFRPVGTIAKPFTGSFTCPVNTEGQPMYAILNLKIHTAEGPYIDYGMSKWEAALFGAVENSSLTNILIINANIKNDNVGDHRGAVVYGDYKPGMDEMPTAPLAGYVINSTVNNCGSTGVIDANSNGCGGLVAWVRGSSITNCWSTVNVKSFGKWNLGGLISHAGESTIVANCWATGNVENGLAVRGALIGGVNDSVVQNCYSTGNAENGFLGRTAGATVSNCYFTGDSLADDGGNTNTTVSNCYVLAGKNPSNGFTSATEAEILDAFKRAKGWDVTGTLPVLTDTKMPADLTAYQVGAAVGTPAGGEALPPAGDTTPTNPQAQPTAPAEEELIPLEELLEIIASLPDDPENITLEHKDDIIKVMSAVEDYADAGDVEPAQHKKAVDSYKALQALMVSDLGTRIDELPAADKLKEKDRETVEAILKDYDFLDDDYKAYIAEELRTKLEEAKQAMEALKNSAPAAAAYTTGEILALVVLAAIIFLNAATNIVITVILFKKKQKETV